MNSIDISIPELIKLSTSPDPKKLEYATNALLKVIENPDSIHIFIDLYLNENEEKTKYNYLVYINKIIKKCWSAYSSEQQQNLISRYYSFISSNAPTKFLKNFASLLSDLYESTHSPELLALVLSSDNQEFVLYLVSYVSSLPEDVFLSSLPRFTQLALWGINQPELFSDSTMILTRIVNHSQDPSLFEAVCRFVLETLPTESSLNEDQASSYWYLVSELFLHKILPLAMFDQFLNSLVTSPHCYAALNWLEYLVPILENDSFINLLKFNAEYLVNCLKKDSSLPEDGFEIVYKSITERCEENLIQNLIKSLFSGDEYHQCVGVYLLSPLLSSTVISSAEDSKYIFECLQTALKSPTYFFQEAALRVISDIEDASTEFVSYFPSLIEAVIPYIASPNSTLQSFAYCALGSLLDECDTEVNGLFQTVWEIKEKVDDLLMPSFMSFLAKLIGLMESVEDDIIDSILEWLEGIFAPSDTEITKRAAALGIIVQLLSKEESLAETLVPQCQQTVMEAFQSNTEGAINSAFEFLKTTCLLFKGESVNIISPYVENLKMALEDPKYQMIAVDTASIYSGYAGDRSLVDRLCQIDIEFLQEQSEAEQQDCGCTSAENLSRVLDDSPNALVLYQLVLNIILKQREPELLNTAFSAARQLYKRCRKSNMEQFSALTFEIFSKLLSGQICYLDGIPPFTNPKMFILIQNLMEYFGTFFKSGPQGVTPICTSLVEWIKLTDEKNIFPIIGALTDAIEFCQIDVSIPSEMCSFIHTTANSISDPDLQQNIAYFLGLICRSFPQQIGLVQQVMPAVLNWWSRALSKTSGFQEVLDNIASLFLSIAFLDQSFPDNLLVGAFKQFPPSDKLETETMCGSAVKLLGSRQHSLEVMVAASQAIARLLIESSSKQAERKVSQEVLSQTIAIFKNLMQNKQIQQAVFINYEKRKAKKQQLLRILSH